MIQIQITFIPAKGTADPWEVASTTVDGNTFSERSRSSCIAKLARTLVAAGVPDQSWFAVSPNGTGALRGRSINAIAKTTITESDKGGLRRQTYRFPLPVATTRGAEEPVMPQDNGEDTKAAEGRYAHPQTIGQ